MITSLVNSKVLENTYADKILSVAIQLKHLTTSPIAFRAVQEQIL